MKQENKISLAFTLLLSMVVITIISFLSMSLIWFGYEYKKLRIEKGLMKKEFINLKDEIQPDLKSKRAPEMQEKDLIETKTILEKNLMGNLYKTLILVIFCMGIVLLISQIITWRLKKNIKNFSDFFSAPDSSLFLDLNKISFSEFHRIAKYANRMNHEKNLVLKSLKETKEWLETILNSVNSGVIVADFENRRITDANRAAEKIIGDNKKNIKNKPYNLFIETREIQNKDFESEFDIESSILRPDGFKVPVLINESFVKISEKDYLIISFVDITEKKSLENSIRHSQKMEAIGTLAGGIAHEFNNILGIMIGYCDLALEKIPEWNPAKRHINEVEKAGMRAKNIILQLLSFSRNRGEFKQPVNIVPVVKESLKLLRSSIPTNIKIKSEFEKEPYQILGDHTQIHQVIINLCTNSYHSMKNTGGEISVSVKNHDTYGEKLESSQNLPPGKYLKIKVDDTGSGIPEDIVDKIFDPYFSTNEKDQSSGMGLAVVHGIVKSHKGIIDVKTKFDRGTGISIFIPAMKDSKKNKNEKKEIDLKGDERILFIDDEKDMIDIAESELTKLGYKIAPFTNPELAIEFFKSNPDSFDILITDMTMPEMTGTRLAKIVNEIEPKVKIILCTGFNETIDKATSKDYGVDEFIMKPYRISELALKIRSLVNG